VSKGVFLIEVDDKLKERLGKDGSSGKHVIEEQSFTLVVD
jgi:hypothetical protein